MTAVTLLLALPAVAGADPRSSVLPVELTCGGETLDLVVPANGRAAAGLYTGSTSVAVLKGVEGEFLVPGFSESDLTTCKPSSRTGARSRSSS